VRPNVLRMRPYTPGKPIEELRRELGLAHIIKLASNENPWGPSLAAVEAIKGAAEELHLYPDGSAYELRTALASHYGVPMGQIVVANGSDELIQMIGLVLLGNADDEVVTCEPSFVRYEASAALAPCKFIHVPLDLEQRYDLHALADALTSRTKIVFIANPNNPTGTAVGKRDLEIFLDRLPESATVVMDEAYYEFACEMQSDYPSSQDYLHTGKVVGLRTFSKAYGLAGVRIGFGMFPACPGRGNCRFRRHPAPAKDRRRYEASSSEDFFDPRKGRRHRGPQ
jgi:histidinol-phosphate aminotransferase